MLQPFEATPGTAVGHDPWTLFSARIADRRDETEGVITFDLELTDPRVAAGYRFLPGQFNMLYVHGVGECAISLSSDSSAPGRLGHTIRMVGQVTNALARQPRGGIIGVRGPFGSVWPLDTARGKNLILAAGGVGLPPLRTVIHHVLRHREDYRRVALVYGAKTVSDLLFPDEYESWRAGGIETLITVDRADDTWRGQRGLVPHVLRKLRLRGGENVVLTCGPEIMMKHIVQYCLDRQIPEDQVFVSLERNMKCACTFCGHCQLGPEFVCKDGPIFAYARVKRYFGREGF
jgi:NAD(P)H-flavin reductase